MSIILLVGCFTAIYLNAGNYIIKEEGKGCEI